MVIIREGAQVLEDKRCCGRGVCIINAKGICWCGQRWDGEKMISSKPDDSKKIELEKNGYQKINHLNDQTN